LIDERYQYIESPRPELYDLNRDPAQKQNLTASERRVAAARRQMLEGFSTPIAEPERIDPEEARKLAALGYVGTAKARSGPLPNPRDEIGQLSEIKKGFLLAERRRYDEAEKVLRALIARNPRLADVWSKLGEILVESGRYGEAVDLYQTAIAHADRFSPELALALAFAYLKDGRAREAIAHAELARGTHPRESHELMARAQIALGAFDEARRHAEEAAKAGDRQPASLLLLADVARAAGDLEGALRTIDEAEARARELGVEHLYGANYLRGDLLARLDRSAEAVAAFHREIAQYPQHMQSYANLAIIHAIEGRRKEAERTLSQLVANNPHQGARELAGKTRRALAK
ncbi:MAG TPA: tetratricopeptide repeat protein, partial [Thermoanaerobaculia bacterium]|nr:tetratricopeptide repeat protein [Thermoanaerobaculia bacterium]